MRQRPCSTIWNGRSRLSALGASGQSRRVGHPGVWPKRCIHAERRGLMQIGDSRYVLLFPLQSDPRDVKTESAPKCRACRLALAILSYRPLKWRTGSAILESLCVSIALTIRCFGTDVAIVTRP